MFWQKLAALALYRVTKSTELNELQYLRWLCCFFSFISNKSALTSLQISVGLFPAATECIWHNLPPSCWMWRSDVIICELEWWAVQMNVNTICWLNLWYFTQVICCVWLRNNLGLIFFEYLGQFTLNSMWFQVFLNTVTWVNLSGKGNKSTARISKVIQRMQLK